MRKGAIDTFDAAGRPPIGQGTQLVTMRDVALAAGVSTATVSHVLNRTRKVTAETAEAVRDAINRCGYMNDNVARAMRTGATRTVGLAMSTISNPYFGDVVHSIEEHLTQQEFSLLLVDSAMKAAGLPVAQELLLVGDSRGRGGVSGWPVPQSDASMDRPKAGDETVQRKREAGRNPAERM